MPGPRRSPSPGQDHLGLEDGGGGGQADLGEEIALAQELRDQGLAPVPGGH